MDTEEPLAYVLNRTFDKMDEADLALVLGQVGRRIYQLRSTTPDTPFWFGVILRLSKWLNNAPKLNDAEKKLIIGPNEANVNGRIRAIRCFRERSGMGLKAASVVIDKWIHDNLPNRGANVSL